MKTFGNRRFNPPSKYPSKIGVIQVAGKVGVLSEVSWKSYGILVFFFVADILSQDQNARIFMSKYIFIAVCFSLRPW